MQKWSFNLLLLSELSAVLDISGAEIARRCGLKQPVLNRYMKNGNVLPVETLIRMCNGLRMPAHFFISEDNHHIIPNRESATIPRERWQPVTWDIKAVELTFGDGEGKIFWKDVATVMDLTSQKPHNQFLLRTRLPIDDFLVVCNHYDISPFRFLIDPNRDASRRKIPDPNSDEAIRNDIAKLNRKVDSLNHELRNMTDNFQQLLNRHNSLLNRFNQMECSVRDYLGLDNNVLMAAETDEQ